jgi:hypothetical protein
MHDKVGWVRFGWGRFLRIFLSESGWHQVVSTGSFKRKLIDLGGGCVDWISMRITWCAVVNKPLLTETVPVR